MNSLITFWRQFVPVRPLIVDATRDSGAARDIAGKAAGAIAKKWDEVAPRERISLMVADTEMDWARVEEMLFRNQLDAVLFPGNKEMAELFAYHQMNLVVEHEGQRRGIRADDAPKYQQILAHHQRYTTPVLPGGQHMDLPGLFKKYSLEARGVIHVGAHEGEEMELYQRMGFKRVIFIEANPAVYQRLVKRVQNKAGVLCLLVAASESNGLELLHITTNDESSSLLPLKRHAELYPQIKEEGRALVASRRLDHLIREIGQNPADYNFLHLDIQGAELKALKGAVETLPGIDAISTEVNYEELYEGCPLVEDLDDFLEPFKFQRMFTATPAHPQWGDAFYLRQPTITMRKLGQWGRFGNQVFEYAFVKIMGKRHRCDVQTGLWVGNQIFGANDPIAMKQYPQHLEQTYALEDSTIAESKTRLANIDVCGVFQFHTRYYAPHKEYFKQLLTPVPALQQTLDGAIKAAIERAGAKTLVALHLRRGDYGYGMFFIPPIKWYQDWLSALWPTLDKPALYIATDGPAQVLPEFAAYKPISVGDLKLPQFGADFYPDYYVLSQAEHLAISNSSFSFSACMLNEKSKTFLRPDLFAGKLVAFDPWNSDPLLHRELGILDYKQVNQILAQYLANPRDPQVMGNIRGCRLQLGDSFQQIKGHQLPLVLAMDLWEGYKMIRKANLRGAHTLVAVEEASLNKAKQALAEREGAEAIGPYIAASMYLAPNQLKAVDLSGLPPEHQELLRT